MRCAAMTQAHTEITHFHPPTMTQVCLNVGGTRYETRLKTLLKGAEQGSEVLAGICQTLTTQHQNYSVSERFCLLILTRTANGINGISNMSPLQLPERDALEVVNGPAKPCLCLVLLARECVTLTLKGGCQSNMCWLCYKLTALALALLTTP